MTACQASVGADAKMQADLDSQVEVEGDASASARARDPDLDDMASREGLSDPWSESAVTSSEPTLLGARRGFSLESTSDAVACQCVFAILGPPTMRQLKWEETPPRTQPETQLFVAFAPDDGNCPQARPGSRGASYWGYRIDGNDVIVFLEEWKQGPPRTMGAVIPKPPMGGKVYAAPAVRGEPYGASADGKVTRCTIGNPAPQRQSPFTALELGPGRND